MSVGFWYLVIIAGYAFIGMAIYVVLAGFFDWDEGESDGAAAALFSALWPLFIPVLVIGLAPQWLARKVKAARRARVERRRSAEARAEMAAAEAASRPPFR